MMIRSPLGSRSGGIVMSVHGTKPVLDSGPGLIQIGPDGRAVGGASSGNRYPGPPLPVPLGSPHCRRNPPTVLSRWHALPSKNWWPARWVKLAAVHGVLARSIAISMTPRFVVMVIVAMPDLGTAEVGSTPTATPAANSTAPRGGRHGGGLAITSGGGVDSPGWSTRAA